MKRRSFVQRVALGMTFVALLSALALAATAAVISMLLWRADEVRGLSQTTDALVAMIEEQASEDGITHAEAGPEAILDSAARGYTIEIWSDGLLLTPPEGDPLGPPGPGGASPDRPGWRLRTHFFPDGVTLLVGAPKADEKHALSTFGWSLLLALPLCVILGVIVGRVVGRRVARPLAEFTEQIRAQRERTGAAALVAPPPPAAPAPAEIEDLHAAFAGLLERLSGTVRRELEFAANASHELRTPLTTIRLQAERGLRGATADGRRALEDQIHEIDRLVRLVDSLLVLARDSRAGLPVGETVNLADLVREFAARIFDPAAGRAEPGAGEGPAAGQGMQPRPALPALEMRLPDEAIVHGDERLLGIVVENLLDNARKFTPAGATVRVGLEAGGETLVLSVTSGGVRIGDVERAALFERFYRGPDSRAHHDGHGLGLPLARHIARLHGGDVTCASGPGEDARFTLEIPAWRAKP